MTVSFDNYPVTFVFAPGSPVWDKYKPPFKFTGMLYSTTVDVSGEMIKDEEEHFKVMMARQ